MKYISSKLVDKVIIAGYWQHVFEVSVGDEERTRVSVRLTSLNTHTVVS